MAEKPDLDAIISDAAEQLELAAATLNMVAHVIARRDELSLTRMDYTTLVAGLAHLDKAQQMLTPHVAAAFPLPPRVKRKIAARRKRTEAMN